MKRIDTYITDLQDKKLSIKSYELGMSRAEILRRAIDLYFEKEFTEKTSQKDRRCD